MLLIKYCRHLVSQFAGYKKDQAQPNDVHHSGRSTLRCCFNMIKSNETTEDYKHKACKWALCPTANITDVSEYSKCVLVAFHEASNQLSQNYTEQRCVQICSPAIRLIVKTFCLGLSLRMKIRSIAFNPTKTQWMEWYNPASSWKKKFKATPSKGKVKATVFGMHKGWFW